MPRLRGCSRIVRDAERRDRSRYTKITTTFPPAGKPGRLRRHPDALLGGKGYDSTPNHRELHRRRIPPVI
ncbi:hypothetical protein ABZ826_00760 [Streptomyces sp. NPDC047515]|uniref:hypothetical protein n=1 Tax=Streptomyces sp. NPDC047515 TaxID=3155380 RepID=UPI0034075E96